MFMDDKYISCKSLQTLITRRYDFYRETPEEFAARLRLTCQVLKDEFPEKADIIVAKALEIKL